MKIKHYTTTSKLLHWLVALIVIPMVLGSFYLEDLPQIYKGSAFMLHKSFGLTILVLMILRLIHIHRAGRPDLPGTVACWEIMLSRVVQYSLYLSLILMPLCGWVMSTAADHSPVYFNLVTLPFPWVSPDKALSDWMFQAHRTLAFVIIGLLCLHILGALKHHWFDKDGVLKNMLPRRGK
ncbi:MAG: cytochrome b [Gammaproteobacteria bacterium]|nr:cytochrome b [Gammaproteobacteria bacterium]